VDFTPGNVPAHKALPVKQFLANKNIIEVEQPSYSPTLARCHFFYFPKIKSVLKGTQSVSVEDMKAKNCGEPQEP